MKKKKTKLLIHNQNKARTSIIYYTHKQHGINNIDIQYSHTIFKTLFFLPEETLAHIFFLFVYFVLYFIIHDMNSSLFTKKKRLLTLSEYQFDVFDIFFFVSLISFCVRLSLSILFVSSSFFFLCQLNLLNVYARAIIHGQSAWYKSLRLYLICL